MGTQKRPWVRWAVPLALAVLSVWFVSQRGSKKKAEAPLPPPVLADGPPAFRQSKTDSNLSPQYFDSIWPAGHRDLRPDRARNLVRAEEALPSRAAALLAANHRTRRHLLCGDGRAPRE
ncbi:MAG: hypothetical protein JRF55_02920 [Deltaproteobacteria bacterium]|nr:hypothetical protein [Deltaproteobacteria bacterium]